MKHTQGAILLAVLVAASTASAQQLLHVDFEGDDVGSQTDTTPAELQRPFANTSSAFSKVVDGANNLAGTGQGIQLYDNGPSPDITGLEYNFVPSLSEQVSAVRVDFNFAYGSINPTSTSKPLHFGLGMYAPVRSFNTSGNRYTDVRFYGDGTIDFVANAPPNLPPDDPKLLHIWSFPNSRNNQLASGSHSLSMFANDYDSQFVDYIGPDAQAYSLPANSVAYWLDGALVMMMNDTVTNEYIIMDLYDVTDGFPPESIMTSENNLGKIGWNSETAATDVNWVFDDIVVSVIPEPSSIAMIGLVSGCAVFIRRRFMS